MRTSNGAFGSRAPVDLAPVATLLLSASLLVLGNGLQGTLLLVRAGNEGFRGEVIGGMMSAYFAGYALGAILLPRIVAAAGHIRAFAGFASIASAVTIVHVLLLEPWVWVVLRGITGFMYAGMILVTESWLNAHAVTSSRARLLSIYGIVTMGAWAMGQGLLHGRRQCPVKFQEDRDALAPHADPYFWKFLENRGGDRSGPAVGFSKHKFTQVGHHDIGAHKPEQLGIAPPTMPTTSPNCPAFPARNASNRACASARSAINFSSGQETALFVDQDRVDEAEGLDALRNLADLFLGVGFGRTGPRVSAARAWAASSARSSR